MLRDEKKILEEELEKSQESNSNLASQLSMITQELEIQMNKNDILLVEVNDLKSSTKVLELEKSSLKTKLEDINKNISNFNKGRENLSKIIENSQSTSNKMGLGYKKIEKPKKSEKFKNKFKNKIKQDLKKTVSKNVKTIKYGFLKQIIT